MKRIITIATVLLPAMAFSQITLEKTYLNAGYWHEESQLLMVDLEASGMSYVEVDRDIKEIRLYYLDHTLFKTVSYASAPPPPTPTTIAILMYISEHLFDLDDGLEFMYLIGEPGGIVTQVYNEDGSLLLNEPDALPFVVGTIHNQQYPVYNTDQGTKLILSHADGTARVYSLGGTLSIGIATSATGPLQTLSAKAMAFPNPVSDLVQVALASPLQYDGELTITDMAGRVMRIVWVAKGTSMLVQQVSDLPVGTYRYLLTTRNTPVTSGNFVRAR